MKTTFLTNLLVAFALSLCGLCTYQWVRETATRKQVQSLHDDLFSSATQIQSQSNSIQILDRRVAEFTEQVASLRLTVKTNELQIRELRDERSSLNASNDFLGRQLEAYTNAFAQAQEKLKDAYENIRKQNEVITNIVAQRDEFVGRLNASIEERNSVVQEYNKLVEQMKQMQASLQATNRNR